MVNVSFVSRWLILALVFSFCLPSALSAFNFTGAAYNSTGSALNVTNVSLYIYQQPSLNPTLILSTLSNGSGYFSLSVNSTYCNDTYSFKPVLRLFSGTGVDVNLTGQTLPDFPYQEISSLSSVNFYLKPAVNLNITAINATGSPVYFQYMVKDTRLGYPIASNFDSGAVINTNVSFPSDRNYSIMLFANQSFPISYELTNLSLNSTYQTSGGNHIDILFNLSNSLRRVSGNVTLNNNTAGFQSLAIVPYIMESGDMLSLDHPMPYNMSAWNGGTDVFNNNTGDYNMTLPGAAMGVKVLLFATAVKNGIYYGSFRNVSLTDSGGEVTRFNLDLKPLAGNLSTITQETQGSSVSTITKLIHFQILTNGSAVTAGNMETKVDYTSVCINCSTFKMMSNINSSGTVDLPLLNASIKEVNIYTPFAAPKKTSYAVSDLSSGQVSVNLTQFNPGEIDPGQEVAASNLEIGIYKSDSSCSIPYPNASCVLFSPTQFDSFSPLTVIMGGGKIDFMMRMRSNNITVKYINVDMLASGPPDALFDSSSNQTTSGADLDLAWRFGSMGPEIYDRVLIGIPYTNIDTSAPVSVILNHLYDQSWNPIWNSSGSLNAENYNTVANGDYADFNSTWFNASLGGMSCSLNNPSADCHINVTNKMIWFKIPHFSGIGPLVNTYAAGNVSANTSVTQIPCTLNCSVFINVTNTNYTLTTLLHNITLNNTAPLGNVNNFSIYIYNTTEWVMNGTNNTRIWDYNLTLYNGSAVTLHQYRININKSNSSTALWNFTYNISGFDALLILQLNLTCVESWTYSDWTTCVDNQQIRTATDANHCGTYDNRSALLQSCAVTSTSSSSSGGGSTGASAGVSTGTPGEFEQKIWTSINKGETAALEVIKDGMAVTKVEFKAAETVYGPWISVKRLDQEDLSKEAQSFTNKAYQYLEISRNQNLKDSIFVERVVSFKVEKAWLDSNKVDKYNVALFRYADNKWTELTTAYDQEDSGYVYYTASTPGFSYFLVGQKAAATAAPAAKTETPLTPPPPAAAETAPETAAETTAATEETATKMPFWLWIVAIIAIIAIIVGLVLWKKK